MDYHETKIFGNLSDVQRTDGSLKCWLLCPFEFSGYTLTRCTRCCGKLLKVFLEYGTMLITVARVVYWVCIRQSMAVLLVCFERYLKKTGSKKVAIHDMVKVTIGSIIEICAIKSRFP